MIKVSMFHVFILLNLSEAIVEAMMVITTKTLTATIEPFLVDCPHRTGQFPRVHSRVHQSTNGSAQNLSQNERYFLNRHYDRQIGAHVWTGNRICNNRSSTPNFFPSSDWSSFSSIKLVGCLQYVQIVTLLPTKCAIRPKDVIH